MEYTIEANPFLASNLGPLTRMVENLPTETQMMSVSNHTIHVETKEILTEMLKVLSELNNEVMKLKKHSGVK